MKTFEPMTFTEKKSTRLYASFKHWSQGEVFFADMDIAALMLVGSQVSQFWLAKRALVRP